VLLVGSPDNENSVDPLIAIAEQNRDRIFFILISEEISATNYKRLVRTGRADWASLAGAPQEVVEILAKRRVTARPAEDGREPVTIAFVPSAGGVGNTTLVAEVGVQLKSRKDMKERSVCIVDLDFQTSHLCDHLDIEARLKVHEILDDPERLDAQLFELFISRHESGLDVFATPRSKFNVSDVDVGTLDALFDMIAQRYDWILIDLPVTWFSWTQEVIANSTGVLVSGINTIPCLRQVSETLASVRSSRSEPGFVAIAVNRCERGLLGGVARREHVKSILRDETIFFIRNDEKAMVESANTGVPVSLSTNREIVKEIAAITSFCADVRSTGAHLPDTTPAKRSKVKTD
jgi:pilus assembly protein CpaE